MKKYPLLNYMGSYAQELLYETSNSALLGIPEALKNATQKIYTQSKLNNEVLYYFQVRTFLETLDLDEDEVSQFMRENPNNQRLGLEIFKILENTLEVRQAQMLARTFKSYTKKEIDQKLFDQFTYIITRLNNHLIRLIEELYSLYISRKNNPNESKYPEDTVNLQYPNMELLSFGFIIFREAPFWGDEYELYEKSKYQVQNEFLEFYEKIFKD
jgi:hypothetical protein